jgi:WhiB family redox-sensing transcriptional regulator
MTECGTHRESSDGFGTGVPWDSEWRQRAQCAGHDTELFFQLDSVAWAVVMAFCLDCPVRTECLAVALDTQVAHGIFGGTTPKWRMDLLKRRPRVSSWRDLLTQARAQHDAHEHGEGLLGLGSHLGAHPVGFVGPSSDGWSSESP